MPPPRPPAPRSHRATATRVVVVRRVDVEADPRANKVRDRAVIARIVMVAQVAQVMLAADVQPPAKISAAHARRGLSALRVPHEIKRLSRDARPFGTD